MTAAPRNAVSMFNVRHLGFMAGCFLLLEVALLLFYLLLIWASWKLTGKLEVEHFMRVYALSSASLVVGLGLAGSFQLGVIHGLTTQMEGSPARAWSTAMLRIGPSWHHGHLWVVEGTLHFQGRGQNLQLSLDELGEVEMSGWLQPQLQWYAGGERYQLQAPDAWGWRRVLTR
jgi:hypothetical protein